MAGPPTGAERSRVRFVDVPENPRRVSAIADDEAVPADAGLSERSVEAIWDAVLDWYRSGTQPFISLCLRRQGKIALHRSVGHARGVGPGEGAAAVQGSPETPVALFSASKMITAMLIHALAERGEVDLEASVASYLPAFGVDGKKYVTVLDLLTHRAGIPQMPGDFDKESAFDFDAIVERLCAAPAERLHAGRQAYHAVTGGYILGAVAQASSGASLKELLAEIFAGPMGLETFDFGIDADRIGEVAYNYSTGRDQPPPLAAISRRALGTDWDSVVELSNEARFHSAIIPAANVVATARDAASFMQMMLDDGRFEGKAILSPETVRNATRPLAGTVFDRMLLVPMRYSAGLMLGNSPIGLYGPMCRRAFGHLGFINIFVWADPDRDIAAALLSTGKSLLGMHLASLARVLTTINWQTQGA